MKCILFKKYGYSYRKRRKDTFFGLNMYQPLYINLKLFFERKKFCYHFCYYFVYTIYSFYLKEDSREK